MRPVVSKNCRTVMKSGWTSRPEISRRLANFMKNIGLLIPDFGKALRKKDNKENRNYYWYSFIEKNVKNYLNSAAIHIAHPKRRLLYKTSISHIHKMLIFLICC